MGNPFLSVTTLKDEVSHFARERETLLEICERRWLGLTPEDVAIARLKRMVLTQTFSFCYTVKVRNANGTYETRYQVYRVRDYLPTRKGFFMKKVDEATIELVINEDFPDDVTAKNTQLAPFDLNVGTAAAQLESPIRIAPVNAADYVFATIRMMTAEYTRRWKHPVGKQPELAKSPG
ncbi:MAG: hypothetical protein DI585_04835 [Pseudomonas fluorescens]|nr:MAG: hypothetical protein DI585_04835 [Pseudomonas fluorescens]